MSRILVVDHYYVVGEGHRANLNCFLRFGSDEDVKCVFIIAGGCTVHLPQARNLKFVHVVSAFSAVSDFAEDSRAVNPEMQSHEHDCLNFLNSSVSGPFLPAYCRTP